MKLLKWGHSLLNIWAIGEIEINVLKKKDEAIMNDRDLMLKTLFNPRGFRKIRTYAEFQSFRDLDISDPRANVLTLSSGYVKDYSNRSFSEFMTDVLEMSGILETVDVRMSYTNFQPGMMDLKDIDTEMGASRVCRDTGNDFPIPNQRNVHDVTFKSYDSPKNDWDMTARKARKYLKLRCFESYSYKP